MVLGITNMALQNSGPVDGPRRDEKGRLLPGFGSLHPGGRPKSLQAMEAMLDAEHRTLAKLRTSYRVLRKAHLVECRTGDNKGFTKLYFDRIQGPVRELSERSDVGEMSDEELEAAIRDGN